ncbi:putative HTH containing protein [Planktothrix serta PCC 8927]|uniref:HTH containing protein n=1 Tax=Planktothrix serta PCC 8927 TaxID=671068 RepID=A0A7Z9BNW9_9CYAN|nr:helix-turn-helix transcriptional regulator [Planktothrix serta]VXD15969.1 putative HTH containing protein [Planktothrix serta PCC 8927]
MIEEENNQEVRRTTLSRQLREKAGLTREQLAAIIGDIAVSTLARWENNGVEPSMTRQQWHNFCRAVGVNFEDLPMVLSEKVLVA